VRTQLIVRRGILVPLAVVAVLAMLAAWWRPANVAWRTAVLTPHLFPDPPVGPVAAVSPEPERTTVNFSPHVPDATADLYFPPGEGRVGLIILLLGAFPYPKDAPQLVNLAAGLTRAGIGLMILDTPDLTAGRIRPGEVVPIADAWRFAAAHPRVDPSQIGYVALSVAGSLLLIALVRDAEFGRGLAFATVFGAYYDTESMLRAMCTASMRDGATTVPWEPAPLARRIFAAALIDAVDDPSDKEALYYRFVLEDDAWRPAVEAVTGPAATLRDLLQATNDADIDRLLDELPPVLQERLAELSPSRYVHRLQTPLFVMHDRADQYVPYVESRRLVEHLPPDTLVRYSEFVMFEHVNPVKSLDPVTFAGEISALYRHLYDMIWLLT